LPAGGMKSHQVPAAIALLQSGSQGVDNGPVLVVLDGPVASEDPDDRLIAVTLAQELAVSRGVFPV